MPVRWSRAHEAKRQAILEAMTREAVPFEDMTEEAQERRRELPFLDWCRTYLPHYFREPFAPFHQRMADVVGEPAMPTFVCAFRGGGKSVLLALARPLHRAVNRRMPYAMYGARVWELAAQGMDYVRIEMERNERLRADYPGLHVEGGEDTWVLEMPRAREHSARGTWQTKLRSVKFEAFGIGSSPRGRRHGPYRPTDFVGDDLEDAQLARNPERERNLWGWLVDEVLPGLEPEVWQFVVLGTMFGPDCMLEHARKWAGEKDPAGRVLAKYFRQAVFDESGHTVWPERFSQQGLERIRAMQGLRYWLRNYELRADDPDKPFQANWFEGRYDRVPRGLDVVCFLDPAVSESARGCPRALVAVGVDADGRRHVLDAWIERGSPLEMVAKLFEFHGRWQPRVMGIEQNGGYALIKPLVAVEEQRRRYRLPLRYVDHTESKDDRIMPLAPEMESGRWLWPARPSAGVTVLQSQFVSYPDGFKDGPDAAAGCTEFLPSAWGGGRKAGDPLYKRVQARRDLVGVL